METQNPPASAQSEVAKERADPKSWMNSGTTKLFRAWHLCVNNPTEVDEICYRKLAEKASFMIAAREVGEECGTPHFQAYAYFKNARSQSAVLKDLKGRGYVKPARCSAEKNVTYCEKQGDVFIREGEVPKQGARSDIARVLEAVERGDTMSQIIQESATNYQDIQIAEKAMKYMEPPRDHMPEVYWYYGASGTGKSADALAEASVDDASVYTPLAYAGKFWDGYDRHEHVIINDYRPGWMPFAVLLQLLDRYEFRVENKGSSRQFTAKKIWITSPFSPEECVPGLEEEYQLLRRLTRITKYEWPVDAIGEDRPRYEPERTVKVVDPSPVSTPLYESDSCDDGATPDSQAGGCAIAQHSAIADEKFKMAQLRKFPGGGLIQDGDYIHHQKAQDLEESFAKFFARSESRASSSGTE